MKKLLLVLVAFAALFFCSYGQVPQAFNYQGVIRDASYAIVANQAVGLRMTLQQGSIGGTTVYSETFLVTTTTNGLVNVQIGGGSVLSGIFTTIDWANGPFFIETAVDATGGSNYVVMGTSQLMSVPYALYAKTSGSFAPGSTTGEMLYWNGSSWQSLPLGTAGQVLTVSSSGPVWQAPSGTSTSSVSIITAPVININSVTASCGGDITSSSTSVISRGICWSNSPNPTTANSFTNNGGGMGTFSGNMTGLAPSTTYYVRAYATNSGGTGYGNEVSFTTTNGVAPAIGQPYLGGTLAYILQPSDAGYDANIQHGIIAALGDVNGGNGITWYNGGYLSIGTGVFFTAIGKGQSNTNALIASMGAGNYAATACDAYSVTVGALTFNDWYLPSRDELFKLYVNLQRNGCSAASMGGTDFTTCATSIGNFSLGNYWSSSESSWNSASRAWVVNFDYGNTVDHMKENTYKARAVRSF